MRRAWLAVAVTLLFLAACTVQPLASPRVQTPAASPALRFYTFYSPL